MKNLRAVCKSITGEVRRENEDNYCFFSQFRQPEQQDTGVIIHSPESGQQEDGQWLGVFDGIGGLPDGDIASLIAASILGEKTENWTPEQETEYEDQLQQTVSQLNRSIIDWRKAHKVNQIGTTIAAMKLGRSAIYGVNSGDSRIYRMRDGKLVQLTKDHVFYYPGHLRPMLMGYLGTELEEESVRADIYQWEYCPGDKYLICTDGVSGVVREREVEEIMAQPVEEAIEALMAAVCRMGARDNATAIILEIMKSEEE